MIDFELKKVTKDEMFVTIYHSYSPWLVLSSDLSYVADLGEGAVPLIMVKKRGNQ